MAWSAREPYNSNLMSSSTSMDYTVMRDEALISTHMLKESSTLHHHLPLTFSPFNTRGIGDVDSTHTAGSTSSACSNIMQALETMKRPLFWPFLDAERVRSLSPDHNVVNEQSASTCELYNVSNTAMMEMMLRGNEYNNEEVEINMNEGESRMRKKKRLTGEQVRALEGSFEADKKLEAERKQQLAQRLGLEPRQVAVWFQNRRARSKTKHLEHDFALLKSKYHYIVAETHKLRSEVSRLTAELEATKGEAAGGANSCEIQLPQMAPLQNYGSNQYTTSKDVKSNNIMEAEYEDSKLLSKSEGNDIVSKGMEQNVACPSMSSSPENSHENVVEGKSSDYNTSPACNTSEGDQECIELPACLMTEATTTRFEYVDTTYNSSLPHLKKVNDIHILQAAGQHLNLSDDCLHALSSHHQVAFDCLWELTTSLPLH